MARRICLVCLVWLIYETLPGQAQEGRLDRVRKDVQGDNPSSSSDSWGNINLGEDEENLPGMIFEALMRCVFKAASLAEEINCPRHNHFIPYPYCGLVDGYRVPRSGLGPDAASRFDYDVEPLRWSARLSIEDGNDFNGLNRANGQFLLETSSGFGLLTSWNQFHERLRAGRSDDLTVGDVNFILSGSRGPDWSLRAGLGFRTLIDHGRTDWGFNFHLGGDYFPARPIVLSIDSDFGTVGDAGVAHGRATIGLMLQRWEIYTGYDALLIGSTTLHGPLVGVRLWF